MTEAGRDEKPRSKLRLARVVLLVALAIYLVAFVSLNTRRVEINFVFLSIRTSLLLALGLVAAVGVAAGFLLRGRGR